MARKGTAKNDRLEEAMALLVQNQAALMQNLTAFMQNQAILMQNQGTFLARLSEMDRVNSEQFGRIEERLSRLDQNDETILRVLSEHARLLEALPEAIREKIGFKPKR